jgi:hypothetical protein
MLRTVRATRYVTPLREGGSLPAIVEADDLGLYVLKFRGAGQGPLALVSELIAGEIGRLMGLRIPELVLVEVDAALGRNEPDAEIRHLLQSSIGLNLALDYLPGSTMFNPAARDRADAWVASEAVWFDAFVTNVDRTVKNPNLLYWHKTLFLIDHGAALYFHHNWPGDAQALEKAAESAFTPIRQHVLLRWANAIEKAAEAARSRLSGEHFAEILEAVPDDWLLPEQAASRRAGYVDYLTRRLEASEIFVQEALRARAELV